MNRERAFDVAVKAHAGQVDNGGKPQILNPLGMMLSVATGEEKIEARLHDVLGDSKWEFENLAKEGFSDAISEFLNAVAKSPEDADYYAVIRRASQNPITTFLASILFATK